MIESAQSKIRNMHVLHPQICLYGCVPARESKSINNKETSLLEFNYPDKNSCKTVVNRKRTTFVAF